MPKFWDYLGKASPKHRNLQDGLFQIASQTCNLLVQVNNTNNISFGDNTTNILSTNLDSGGFKNYTSRSEDSEQLVVLLPPSEPPARIGRSKQFSGLLKPRLSTVLEGAPLTHDEDGELWNHGFSLPGGQDGSPVRRYGNRKNWCKPSCIPISIILLLIFLVVLLPLLDHATEKALETNILNDNACRYKCSLFLVETIPDGMRYPQDTISNPSTFDIWLHLINGAQTSINIASTYWTLRQAELYPDPTSAQGEDVFSALLEAAIDRGVSVKVVQNIPSREYPNIDTDYLTKKNAAEIRNLNIGNLLGRGTTNSNFFIVDDKHFYIGSAGMDWRALTQTKELGVAGYNCTCLADDIKRIFNTYWELSERNAKIPEKWQSALTTKFNSYTPINVTVESNNDSYQIFISTSPAEFLPNGRANNLDTVLDIIQHTENYIHIFVMEYIPLLISYPSTKYWPGLENALKEATIDHQVKIKMLVGSWNQTWDPRQYFLRSFADISNFDSRVSIEVRRFIISGSEDQLKIPRARVSHNNYLITESVVYISTTTWTGNDFTDNAGVGFVVYDRVDARNNARSIRAELELTFERDWNSKYSFPVAPF